MGPKTVSFKAQCPPPTPRGCGTFCIQELQVSHGGRWLEMTQSVPVTHWPERHGGRNLKVRRAEPLSLSQSGNLGQGRSEFSPIAMETRQPTSPVGIFIHFLHLYQVNDLFSSPNGLFCSMTPASPGLTRFGELSSSQGNPVILWGTSMGAGRVQSSQKPPHLGHCTLWPKETAICLIQDGSRLVFTWWSFRESGWDCTAEEGHPCIPQEVSHAGLTHPYLPSKALGTGSC